MEAGGDKLFARLERIRELMEHPGEFYYTCIARAAKFGRRYPDYRIQIDPVVKQIILEMCECEPGYFPQSVLDRFEEMDEGFNDVRCFQAEEAEFFKEEDRDFLVMDPDLARYRKERSKKTMFAKLAAIEGRPISPMDAKIIADFESQHGDMLDFSRGRIRRL